MKKSIYFLAIFAFVSMLAVGVSFGFSQLRGAKASSVTCTPTNFVRDNINLTAALINPPGTYSGTLDATGCNIGIYYNNGVVASVNGAEVHGANYFGIVNDGATVNITRSNVHDIGEVPFNGTQHGVAIYFSYGSASQGSITHNQITNYQKGGIAVNGASSFVKIDNNTVSGQGPVNYIAQNGIQIRNGVQAEIKNNIVTGNAYTGAGLASSVGILIVGGSCNGDVITTQTKIKGNTLTGNDVGIFLANSVIDFTNPAQNCIAPTVPTKIAVSSNTVKDGAVTNTSGNNPGAYQVGISDSGNLDSITSNSICGAGYTPISSPNFVANIDITFGYDVTMSGNIACSASINSQALKAAHHVHDNALKAAKPVR